MLFWAVYLFPVCFLFTYFFCLQRFFSVMKDEDNELWKKMGEPHLIMNNSIQNGISVISSFITSSFTKSTPKVVFWGNLSRVLLIGFLILMIFYSKIVVYFGFEDFMWNSVRR
jgi:hypothetical protein